MSITQTIRRKFSGGVIVWSMVFAFGGISAAAFGRQDPPPQEPAPRDQPFREVDPDEPLPPQPGVLPRPPGGGRPGGPPLPLWERMPQKERERIIEFVREHFPRMSEEFAQIHDKHKERFERRMRRLAPEILRLMEMMEVDPERAGMIIRERRLDLKLRSLMHRYRRSEDKKECKELGDQVRDTIEKLFDCRLERREMEIRGLQIRLKELQERLEESQEMRAELIERVVRKHLREAGKPRHGIRRPGADPRGRGHRQEPPPLPPDEQP